MNEAEYLMKNYGDHISRRVLSASAYGLDG